MPRSTRWPVAFLFSVSSIVHHLLAQLFSAFESRSCSCLALLCFSADRGTEGRFGSLVRLWDGGFIAEVRD